VFSQGHIRIVIVFLVQMFKGSVRDSFMQKDVIVKLIVNVCSNNLRHVPMFINVFKQLNIVNNICEPEKNVFYFKICISLSSKVYLVL